MDNNSALRDCNLTGNCNNQDVAGEVNSAETITCVATVVVAAANIALAIYTALLVRESKRASKQQLGVNSWLTMQQRFDSKEMVNARKKLAVEMKNYQPKTHVKISETVLNFFEDVGILWKTDYIDKKLADSSFSFYAPFWHEACKSYIDTERRRQDGDESMFEHFEDMANEFRKMYPNTSVDETSLNRFLEDEARIVS